jgi:hypothetical protein
VFVGLTTSAKGESTRIAATLGKTRLRHAGPDPRRPGQGTHPSHGRRSFAAGAGRTPAALCLPRAPGRVAEIPEPDAPRAGTSACSITATRAPTTAASWWACRCRPRMTRPLPASSRRWATPMSRKRQPGLPAVPAELRSPHEPTLRQCPDRYASDDTGPCAVAAGGRAHCHARAGRAGHRPAGGAHLPAPRAGPYRDPAATVGADPVHGSSWTLSKGFRWTGRRCWCSPPTTASWTRVYLPFRRMSAASGWRRCCVARPR